MIDHEHSGMETIDLEALMGEQPEGSAGRTSRMPRPSFRAIGPAMLGLLLATVLAWVGLAAWELTALRSDVLDARGDLDAAATVLSEGDVVSAVDLLGRSEAVLGAVGSRVRGPKLLPARLVPYGRRNLDALSQMAQAAAIAADAGLDVLDVLDGQAGGLGALTPRDGRIPLETLRALGPALATAAERFDSAAEIVLDLPTRGLDQQLIDARVTFLDTIGPIATQLATVSPLVEALPAILGEDDPRTYVVASSNPTETRGTGGYFGAFAVLTAEDGVLSFGPTRDIFSLPVAPPGTVAWPDESLAGRYDSFGGSGFMPNVNLTPDFPSAAATVVSFFQDVEGTTVDGVLALDPFAFQALLTVAGPVEVPGIGTVSADDVVEFVSRSAYSLIVDPEERKRLIGEVATASFLGFLSNPAGADAGVVMPELGQMVRRASLQMYLTDPGEQSLLVGAGVAGVLMPDRDTDLLGVFLNSGTGYKVDYWLQREMRYDVQLDADGRASGTLSTGFMNGAPTSGEPAYMIGTGAPPLDVGDNLMYVSVYCAPGCEIIEVPDVGFDDLPTTVQQELGLGVGSTWMRLPAGQSRELAWSYTVPRAWVSAGADRLYTLRYEHQTAIRPARLQVNLALPEGFQLSAGPPGAVEEDGVVRLDAEVVQDETLEFRLSPVEGQR